MSILSHILNPILRPGFGSGSSGSSQNLIAHESFTSPNGASVPGTALDGFVGGLGAWSVHPASLAGAATISGGGVSNSSSGLVEYFLCATKPAGANFRASAIFAGGVANSGVGMLFRFNPVTLDGYSLRLISVDTVQLRQISAGTATELQTWTVAALSPLPTRYLLSVDVVGTSMTVYFNGTALGTVVGTLPAAGDRMGARITSGGTPTTILMEMWIHLISASQTATQLPSAAVESYGWDSNPGNWLRVVPAGNTLRWQFTGEYCAIRLNCFAGVTGNILVRINNGAWRRYNMVGASNDLPIFYQPGSTAVRLVELLVNTSDSNSDNWGASPVNAVVGTHIVLASGGLLSLPSPHPGPLIVGIADSNGRGGPGGAVNGFMWFLKTSLQATYISICHGGQGYCQTGQGNVPVVKDAIDLYSTGRTRAADPRVDEVIVHQATNDGTFSDAAIYAAALLAFPKIRTLWPNARITFDAPPGYQGNTGSPSAQTFRDNKTTNGIHAAYTAWADANKQFVDLTVGTPYGNQVMGPSQVVVGNPWTVDNIHYSELMMETYAADLEVIANL